MRRRAAPRAVAAAALLAALAGTGCGQKGPLVLPGQPAAGTAEQAPPVRDDDEREDDE